MLQEIIDEEFEWIQETERNWKSTQKNTYQIAEELLQENREIFKDLPEILEELKEQKREDEEKVKTLLRDATRLEGIDRIFWEMLIKHLRYQKTHGIEKNIQRIHSLLCRTKKKKTSHITQEQIESARERSIIEIAERNLPKVIKKGSRARAVCPFHPDKTPSLTFFENTQSWYCFGCQKGGDTISFVRELLHLEFKEAVKYLIS